MILSSNNLLKYDYGEANVMKTAQINAVYEEDIKDLLKSLDMLDYVESGHGHCSECDENLMVKDISLIYPENRQVKLCCENLSCYMAILKRKNTK